MFALLHMHGTDMYIMRMQYLQYSDPCNAYVTVQNAS